MRRRLLALAVAIFAAAAGIATAASAPAAGTSVLGEWRFAESQGQQRALDDGPLGLDGQLGTSAEADARDPQRVPGVADGALRFDAGSLVRLPNDSRVEPRRLTVEAVVRADASPGRYRYIVSRGGWQCFAGAWGLYSGVGGGIAFYVFDGERFFVSPAARVPDVWDGAWHHVAGVFDGASVRLYVDGRPVGEPTRGTLEIDYEKASRAMAFGAYVGACDLAFAGDIDLVRLSGYAFSPHELIAASTAALRRPVAPHPLPADPTRPVVSGDVPAGGPPASAPGAPLPACRLKVLPRRIRAGRHGVLRARVTLRSLPVAGVRVRAAVRGRRLARARTRGDGTLRLRLRAPARGRIRVTAAVTPRCRAKVVRVGR